MKIEDSTPIEEVIKEAVRTATGGGRLVRKKPAGSSPVDRRLWGQVYT